MRSVSEKNKNLLWAVSAGRCEYDGCNEILHTDILTNKRYNSAYIAHIVADVSGGPRGDVERSSLLRDDISNLMLLCDSHHRLIDKAELTQHSEKRLLDMKQKHEERIKLLTDINTDMSSQIILFGANIGNNNSTLSYLSTREALLYDYYPASFYPIELSLKNSPFTDDKEDYWCIEEKNLCLQFDQKVKPSIRGDNSTHYSVFALAPQPLLIKLGVLLNDLNNVRVFQKHREPFTWKWQDYAQKLEYVIHKPKDKTKIPVLVLSLSGNVNYNRVTKVLGENVSVWEITLSSNPNNDFLKTEALLVDFRRTARSVLNQIKLYHGCVDLHVFPALPVSASIELGRVWMTKVDMPLVIYDANNKSNDFHKTITIN